MTETARSLDRTEVGGAVAVSELGQERFHCVYATH
jgi:hypothetical protein